MDTETQVHHAIIDLYELEDQDEVISTDICECTGLSKDVVDTCILQLVGSGLIDCDERGVVIYADNNGYYPTTEVQ